MKYALLVFLGGCSYGILSTIVKIAYAAGLTPAEVCGGQVFFGMLLLWMAALRHRGFPLNGRRALTLICCGMPIGLTTMFYYTALQTVTASFAIILLFQFVWVSTAIDCVFSRRLPDRQKIAAIAILLPGSVLAAGLVGSSDSISLTSGVLWGLASAVSYSFVLLVSGTVGCEVPPVLKSALLSLGSLAAAAPYGIPLGIFGIALPPLLFSIGIPHTGPSLGSILTSSELPMAILMAFFVLGEHIALVQWLGVALIFLGVIVGNLRTKG